MSKIVFKDTTINRIYKVLEYISMSNNDTNKVIFISGNTYGSKIDKITNLFDIDILINRYATKLGFLRFLPIPKPKEFLIRVKNRNEIKDIVRKLEDYGPIEIYIFSKSIESEFIDKFQFLDIVSIEKILSQDPEYLIYGADFDNLESSTEMLEFSSFGIKTPKELIWFL